MCIRDREWRTRLEAIARRAVPAHVGLAGRLQAGVAHDGRRIGLRRHDASIGIVVIGGLPPVGADGFAA